VGRPDDQAAVKAAIDLVFDYYTPDYLVLLGAPDVVPHQDLANPLYAGGIEGDDDEFVPSDLPYACAAPYSTEIVDFRAPDRVVSRLPDIAGVGNPEYLEQVLEYATGWVSQPVSAYAGYFGLSASVWQGSTRKSLRALFGSSSAVQISPPDGPNWSPQQLGSLVHFINCHGAPASPIFVGDDKISFPDALDAARLFGVRGGTVAAAECCYGAELYDPQLANGQHGIPNEYLRLGTYGYLGSSNIAYGLSSSTNFADLICQYYLKNVLSGASSGRAMLMARQTYVGRKRTLNAHDLKTLAQFNLLGDASIHPVDKDVPRISGTESETIVSKSLPKRSMEAVRRARRNKMRATAIGLFESVAYVEKHLGHEVPEALRAVAKGLEERGIRFATSSFEIVSPTILAAKSLSGRHSAQEHVIMYRSGGENSRGITQISGVICEEHDGEVTSVVEFTSR